MNSEDHTRLSDHAFFRWLGIISAFISIFAGTYELMTNGQYIKQKFLDLLYLPTPTETVQAMSQPTATGLITSKILAPSDYGKLIYEENFDKDDESWALQNGSTIKDGVLTLQPNTSASPYSDNQFSNFIFETAFRHINPTGNSETDFYLRQQVPPCPGWNCSIQIWISGDWKTLGSRRVMGNGGAIRIVSDFSAPQLSSTDWNKLTVIVKNDEYATFVNDVFIQSFTDSMYKKGKFAIGSNPGGTSIDYVRIYALP